MSDPHHYMRYILAHHRSEIIQFSDHKTLFTPGDSPKSWNMKKLDFTTNLINYWEVGFIYRNSPGALVAFGSGCRQAGGMSLSLQAGVSGHRWKT